MAENNFSLQKTLTMLLDEKKYHSLRDILSTMNPADIAAIFDDLDQARLPLLFRLLPKELAAETFVEMEPEAQELLIQGFSDSELKEVIDELYVDDAVDIVEEMPANVVQRILSQAEPDMRKQINEILRYPEDSAGSIMTTEYVSLRPNMTVEEAILRIRRTGIDKETIYTCYVTRDRKLIGIVTVKDSSWLLSWTLNRQQQFKDQPKNQLCVWVYGLFSDKPGDYVKKPMRDCTGREICMEWLYHIGVPEDQIAELAEHSANTVPVMMPYIDAFFMPRAMGDRPDVVPEGAVNFAFLGQFAETARDTIFTTEYSMRTGMEAVYTLLNIDRGVPEVWGSTYDVRALIDATVKLRDGKKITDMDLPLIPRLAMKEALKKIEGTDLEKFLKEYNAI